MKLTNTLPDNMADSEIHSRRIRAWIKVDTDDRREAPSVIKRNENDRVSRGDSFTKEGTATNREEITGGKAKEPSAECCCRDFGS